jgi:hypothetical protein
MIFGEANVDQVMRGLEDWLDSFNFLRRGEDQCLGRDVMNEVVEGIQTRSIDNHQGADDVWPKNAEKYRKWKDKRYGTTEPNVRTGEMLSELSLRGRSIIEAELVTMRYGLGVPPTRAAFTDKPLTEADKSITDIEKAYFAHTGQSAKKIRRPFYELDETIAANVRKVIAENLNDFIAEANQNT